MAFRFASHGSNTRNADAFFVQPATISKSVSMKPNKRLTEHSAAFLSLPPNTRLFGESSLQDIYRRSARHRYKKVWKTDITIGSMTMAGGNTPDLDGIWGSLEPASSFLEYEFPQSSLIDTVGSDDFLFTDVDVRFGDNIVSDSSADTDWELTGEAAAELDCMPSFLVQDFDPRYDERAPRTPSPPDRSLVYKDGFHQVTPEKPIGGKISLPGITELQMEYQRTLQKLATSMRRSDETRGIVKRQRLTPGNDETRNFFLSERAKAMEDSRQKLYGMIQDGIAPEPVGV